MTSDTAPQRRGARAYFVASGVSQIAALVRYVLLARLLGPEQLGLAATLILTGVFFDLISETAADRFLIQDKDGDHEAVQRLVQLVLVLRGVGISVSLAVLAWPIAAFYNAPRLAPALAILGLSPFVAGFIHLDMRRVQRDNDFRAEGFSLMSSEVAGLIATVIAAYFTRSFTSVLYGLIARSFVLTLCSHLFAKRPYVLGYSKDHGPRLGRFSVPLIATGVILFFAGQGDRVLVVRGLGFAVFGHYSAVLLLIYYPASVVRKYTETIFLPLVAATRADSVRRAEVVAKLGSQALLLALAMAAGFAIVAPPMVGILYGRVFSQAAPIVALIGILQSARFLILWPTTVAMAMARSGIVLSSNIVRLTAWPMALIGVAFTHDLYGVVIGFIFGELLALALALVLLNKSERNKPLHDFDRFALFVAASVCILGWSYVAGKPSTVAFGGLLAFTTVLMIWVVRSEFATIRSVVLIARRLTVR